ncbi:uncharacterized protein [Venturia canescens]|uniref:uncharacterized protein n=1 Tax=Venturia canescens TaxID=32260 RepID=UPI001C9D3C8F|nr:uncharacterized protein LOC122409673 [Venturia canescens]
MPSSGFRRAKLGSDSTRLSHDVDNRIICNCDGELRLGYGVAVSLAIFEAKRFCLLALELFLEWQVIRFAGGYRPVVLTFVDISLGFPCALAAVFTIRILHEHFWDRRARKICNYLRTAISICAILNILTMVSIGMNMSVRRKTISNIFNASMYFYEMTESYKYTIDQIQLALQCCGHTSYTDWFLFDWQVTKRMTIM